VKPIVGHTTYTAYAGSGFVFILARPPPESSPSLWGLAGLVLPWLVPVGAFARGAELWLTLALGGPFMAAPLTGPVPNNLFYSRHTAILSEIVYERK
jgi:hypothetical protein